MDGEEFLSELGGMVDHPQHGKTCCKCGVQLPEDTKPKTIYDVTGKSGFSYGAAMFQFNKKRWNPRLSVNSGRKFFSAQKVYICDECTPMLEQSKVVGAANTFANMLLWMAVLMVSFTMFLIYLVLTK